MAGCEGTSLAYPLYLTGIWASAYALSNVCVASRAVDPQEPRWSGDWDVVDPVKVTCDGTTALQTG